MAVAFTYIGSAQASRSGAGNNIFDFGNFTLGAGTCVIIVGGSNTNSKTVSSSSFGGSAGAIQQDYNGGQGESLSCITCNVGAGAIDISVTFVSGMTSTDVMNVDVYSMTGHSSNTAHAVNGSVVNGGTDTLTVAIGINGGSLHAAFTTSTAISGYSWNHATVDHSIYSFLTQPNCISVAHYLATAAESPHSETVTYPASRSGNQLAMAVSWNASTTVAEALAQATAALTSYAIVEDYNQEDLAQATATLTSYAVVEQVNVFEALAQATAALTAYAMGESVNIFEALSQATAALTAYTLTENFLALDPLVQATILLTAYNLKTQVNDLPQGYTHNPPPAPPIGEAKLEQVRQEPATLQYVT